MFEMIDSSPQEAIPSFNEGRAEQSQRAGKKLRQTMTVWSTPLILMFQKI